MRKLQADYQGGSHRHPCWVLMQPYKWVRNPSQSADDLFPQLILKHHGKVLDLMVRNSAAPEIGRTNAKRHLETFLYY